MIKKIGGIVVFALVTFVFSSAAQANFIPTSVLCDWGRSASISCNHGSTGMWIEDRFNAKIFEEDSGV